VTNGYDVKVTVQALILLKKAEKGRIETQSNPLKLGLVPGTV
jgi:hypothetical protein